MRDRIVMEFSKENNIGSEGAPEHVAVIRFFTFTCEDPIGRFLLSLKADGAQDGKNKSYMLHWINLYFL